MKGLVGRGADGGNARPESGHYTWYYVPDEGENSEEFSEYAFRLRQWLDLFDVQFSGTECFFGNTEFLTYKGKVLYVCIVATPIKATP